MVHRPADSRLLSNLLQQEKDYLKQFNQLFNSSAASLHSFTAYAAASPPPASQVILNIAGLLSTADDALKRYALGVEHWRDAMRILKDMEDDVGNIMRDREILVTRLIKVSKSHKSNSGTFRESLLIGSHQHFPSSSSLSLSVGNSDSPSPSPSRPVSASFQTSTKLAAAQTELQACETHLASKESELALKRCAAVREGFSARAKAMVECSWAWSQLGKQILRSLDDLGDGEAHRNEHGQTMPRDERNPTDSTRPSSDFSSIAPSQSASQVNWEPNMTTAALGQPIDDNTVPAPDAKRLSVSGPRPHSSSSTAPSLLYPGMPATYKLETVTYAPAIALVVPGKDALSNSSSSPPRASSPLSSLAIPPPLGTYAPTTEESSQDQAQVGSGATWHHSREGSQEGLTRTGYSAQSQRTSLVPSASEPNSWLGSNAAMSSNTATSTSTLHPQRHVLERRITEEEIQVNNSSTVDLSHGGQQVVENRVVTSALVEIFDDPEEEDDEDELPIEVEDQLIQQGKLAVVENPRFMSEERKRELERERERERMRAANVEEGQEQESEPEPVEQKKRFSFLHPKKPTPRHHAQSQSDTGHLAVPPTLSTAAAAPSTPKTSPNKTGEALPYTSPSKTSPSKRFFGSLKGLFGVRQPGSPSLGQESASPSPSKFGTRKQERNHSPSRIRTTEDDLAADADADSDSDADSPSKTGGGLQALFRGAGGAKKKVVGPASDTKWSTRTDRNIKKLARTGGLDDDDDVDDRYLSQVVGGTGKGIAGNAVVQAGLVGPEGAGRGRARKRSTSDTGIGRVQPPPPPPPPVVELTGPKDLAGGGKRLKKTQPPSAAALHTSSQRDNTSGAPHAPTLTPVRKSGERRSTSVDEGARRVEQAEAGGGGGPGMIVDLGKKRRRAASDIAGPSLMTTTNAPVAAAAPASRGVATTTKSPAAGISKGYSSDTAAVSSHAATKSGVKTAAPAPTAAPIPAAAPATATPSRPTPTRKTSTGKTQSAHTTPNIKAGGSTQPHVQPSHFTPGGGATVLAAGGSHPSGTLVSHPGWDAQALPTPGGGLSRNNSMVSTASAPAGSSGGGSGMSKTKKQKQTVLGHGMGSGPSLGRRNSLGSSSGHASGKGSEKKTVAPGGSSTGPIGSVVQPAQPAPSLMSIVEDVAKHNREWTQESSQLLKSKHKVVGGLEKESVVGMVDVVKAPRRVGRDELAQLDPAAIKARVMETSMMSVTTGVVVSASASAGAGGGGGTRLVDVKAPGSIFDQRAPTAQQGMHQEASNSTPNLTHSQQVHQSSLTRRASVTAIPSASAGRRPAKSPLRSALKNQSRTPSPLPGPFLVSHLQKQQQHVQQQAVQEGSRRSDKPMVAPVPVAPTRFSTILGSASSQPQSATNDNRTTTKAPTDVRPTMANGRVGSYDSASQRRQGKGRKQADSEDVVRESGDAGDSASTNDTGNEIFYTDDEGDHSDAVVASSATDKPPMLNGHADGYTGPSRATGVIGSFSELSHSTTSTAVAQPPPLVTVPSAPQPTTPRRRKSVRVSLQPTFSPSPPAIEYDDEEEQKYHAPWAWDHRNTEGVTGSGGQHVHAPVPVAATSPFLTSGHRQKVVAPEQPGARVYDIWEDSSDEDVEYQKAKRLLTRAARKEKDMNAFAAGSRS